jgi:hypothetical protein
MNASPYFLPFLPGKKTKEGKDWKRCKGRNRRKERKGKERKGKERKGI